MKAELLETPLQSRVSQQSLVKVKFKPMANFSPVSPHRAGRTQLFSYKTTLKSAVQRKLHTVTCCTFVSCIFLNNHLYNQGFHADLGILVMYKGLNNVYKICSSKYEHWNLKFSQPGMKSSTGKFTLIHHWLKDNFTFTYHSVPQLC